MNIQKIQYGTPLFNETSAREILKPQKKWWHLRKKILKQIELVFLPFYYFELRTESKKSDLQRANFVVDGITGVYSLFDPIELTNTPPVNTSVFQFELTLPRAREIGLFEYKRSLLNYGLKQHVFIEVKEILLEEKFFYPFWIGYYVVGKKYDFLVIDALSGKMPGIKLRRAFLSAFNQAENNIHPTSKTPEIL
jgi:hypothetical protein